MAKPNYISLQIDGVNADIDPAGQVPKVSYSLEDSENFENKTAATSFDIELPATLINDQIHNTMHDPSVVDNTALGSYDNFKSARYIANGQEILIGKYLEDRITEQFGRPVKYHGKIYGLNGDWVIDLKEKTLFDFVNPRTHTFDAATIAASWYYDGRSEVGDYVYAPVRYRKPFGDYPAPTDLDPDPQPLDDNAIINDLKPAMSVYWILYRAFRSVGYRIVSTFMDTDYYRRGVLPWTWGGFDFVDDSRWEPFKFMAAGVNKSVIPDYLGGYAVRTDNYNGYPNMYVVVNNAIGSPDYTPGTFENIPGLFAYTGSGTVLPYMMQFKYPGPGSPYSLGNIRVGLSVQVNYYYKTSNNSRVKFYIDWIKNGTVIKTEMFLDMQAPDIGRRDGSDFLELFFEGDIVPGDYIGARIHYDMNKSTFGSCELRCHIDAFQLNYVRMGPSSTVDIKNNYPKFKNYKLMDLLRGEIDLFDLSIQTDPVRKEIYIEPTHAYDVNNTPYKGYFTREQLDYSQKVDLNKEASLERFSEFEREFIFKFQDDSADGGLKKVQDRNRVTIGQSKYLLPERFKAEKKEKENRFYSPVMHVEHDAFKTVTGVSPQLIAMIPENIANTSASESENTYAPKRAWYKGNVTGFGGWKFNGTLFAALPFMFAVNYKPGGETDPILSYSDQTIGANIGKGLMNKFYLQRMAIFRHGRRYNQRYLMLNNADVTNFLHRESIIINSIEYLLTEIKDYDPIDQDSTGCTMWMFVPVGEKDKQSAFPSIQSLRSIGMSSPYDIKYWPHTLLKSDIPK